MKLSSKSLVVWSGLAGFHNAKSLFQLQCVIVCVSVFAREFNEMTHWTCLVRFLLSEEVFSNMRRSD